MEAPGADSIVQSMFCLPSWVKVEGLAKHSQGRLGCKLQHGPPLLGTFSTGCCPPAQDAAAAQPHLCVLYNRQPRELGLHTGLQQVKPWLVLARDAAAQRPKEAGWRARTTGWAGGGINQCSGTPAASPAPPSCLTSTPQAARFPRCQRRWCLDRGWGRPPLPLGCRRWSAGLGRPAAGRQRAPPAAARPLALPAADCWV